MREINYDQCSKGSQTFMKSLAKKPIRGLQANFKKLVKLQSEVRKLNDELFKVKQEVLARCHHEPEWQVWCEEGKEDTLGNYSGSDEWIVCSVCGTVLHEA